MGDCIFCKIANGEIPSATLYEDEELQSIFFQSVLLYVTASVKSFKLLSAIYARSKWEN